MMEEGPVVAEPADVERRIAFLDHARHLHPRIDHHVAQRHPERSDPRRGFFIFYLILFKLNSNNFCPIDRKWERKTQKFEKEREIQK
jgi:hypothetical protein